ncbi:MAG: hypothetical protein IKF71_00025 [Bacilli bacterium]|nr:hypothetical protein [Bacilli bacterium]
MAKKQEKKAPNFKILIIVIAISIIVFLGSFFGVKILSKNKNDSETMSFAEAKEQSQKMAKEAKEQADKTRQQINDLQNYVSIKDENIKKQIEKELEGKVKSEIYKQYEQLPQEEKDKVDAIPREEDIPMDVIDDIIEKQEEMEIPSKYSLQDVIDIKVEDQGNRGLCWDFAAVKSLETFLSLHEKKDYDFSEQHVNYMTSNLLYGSSREIDGGGTFSDFEKYLLQSGVVLEKDVPYEKDYDEQSYSKFIDMEPVKIVTETVNFPSVGKDPQVSSPETIVSDEELQKFRNTVKKHIMQNGSVFTAIDSHAYSDVINPRFIFRSKEYTGLKMTNHAISIVGWDDSFPKERFKFYSDGKEILPEHDGAYIALNSWGTRYTDENGNSTGYFYISYDDIFVEQFMSGIISAELNESTAIEFDSIKSKDIKNIIAKKYYYGLKEKDNKQYVTNLLLNKITNLVIKDAENFNLEDLKMFKNLSGLTINNSNLTSIDKLPNFVNLYYINLNNNKISNIDKLANYSSLKSIMVSNNQIEDVSNLNNLSLSMADFSGNSGIKGYGKLDVKYYSLDDIDENELEAFDYKPDYLSLSNNNLSDLTELKNNNLSYVDISKNPITNLDVFKEDPAERNIESSGSGGHQTSLSIVFTDSELTDITMFNNLKANYLTLSRNKFTSLKDFEPGTQLSELILSNNEIQNLDEFKINDNLSYLDLGNNKISDISSFDSKNISTLTLTGNKNIKGYGNLKVNYLQIDNCNISELENLNDTIRLLNISNNQLEDISVLSSAENLNTLWFNNNKKEVHGSLNSNVETISIKDTSFSKDFNWKCSGLNSVETTDIHFDKNLIKENGYITYSKMDFTPETISDILDETHNVYLQECSLTLKANKQNDMVDISKLPFISTYYYNINLESQTDNVAISRDRKKLIILDQSVNEIKENMNFQIDSKYIYTTVKIELKDSSNIMGSIRNIFHKIVDSVIGAIS